MGERSVMSASAGVQKTLVENCADNDGMVSPPDPAVKLH